MVKDLEVFLPESLVFVNPSLQLCPKTLLTVRLVSFLLSAKAYSTCSQNGATRSLTSLLQRSF
uniref:Uncharacterized protein n=1 Tax=Anguilla anguilla TaxID=7936 RepID=A0A0E9SE48_ANGAN